MTYVVVRRSDDPLPAVAGDGIPDDEVHMERGVGGDHRDQLVRPNGHPDVLVHVRIAVLPSDELGPPGYLKTVRDRPHPVAVGRAVLVDDRIDHGPVVPVCDLAVHALPDRREHGVVRYEDLRPAREDDVPAFILPVLEIVSGPGRIVGTTDLRSPVGHGHVQRDERTVAVIERHLPPVAGVEGDVAGHRGREVVLAHRIERVVVLRLGQEPSHEVVPRFRDPGQGDCLPVGNEYLPRGVVHPCGSVPVARLERHQVRPGILRHDGHGECPARPVGQGQLHGQLPRGALVGPLDAELQSRREGPGERPDSTDGCFLPVGHGHVPSAGPLRVDDGLYGQRPGRHRLVGGHIDRAPGE